MNWESSRLDGPGRHSYPLALDPIPAPRLSLKSPLLALLISIPLPGFGHFYLGSFLRGFVILIAVYIILPALTSLHGGVALIGWVVAVGFVARDAWLCAKAEVLKETSELAAGVKPRGWIVWAWAACRAAWIVSCRLAASPIASR